MHAHYNAYRKTLNHTGASRHRDASELARVPGINAQMAQTLYDWFHQ